MPPRCRRFKIMVLGVLGLVATACSSGVSVDVANPVPIVAETPTETPSAENVRAEDLSAEGPDSPAADPASTVASEGAGQQSTSEPEIIYGDIHDVDFFNGFVYDAGFGDGDVRAEVTNGSFENGEYGDDEYYWFGATDIAYGDLDGDGAHEAVVVTTWNGGGTGYFDSVTAFRLVDGRVEALPRIPFGDRADGGIHRAEIADGRVQVWAYAGGEGACCPNALREHTLVMGDYELVRAETAGPRSWLSVHDGGELTFLPNTSEGAITLYGQQTSGSVLFEAGAGQRVTVRTLAGPFPEQLSMHVVETGAVVDASDEEGRAFVLPADALFELSVGFDAPQDSSTLLTVGIDAEPASQVSWTPTFDQLLVDDEPFVRTAVAWPVFASDQLDIDAANAALAGFATGLDDDWVVGVTEYEDPLDDSTYEAAYKVTFASREVVSVRFDFYEYVCCRAYPNYGARAAVVDLVRGRLVGVDEILDLSRLDEFNRLWFAAVEADGSMSPDQQIVEGEAVIRFDSLSLVPNGIEFGTDRGALGGGSPGTVTILTFVELGDLVNAEFLARLGR